MIIAKGLTHESGAAPFLTEKEELQQRNMQLQTENEELNSQLQEMQPQGLDMQS